jgi:hypothetical protein
MVSLLFGSIFLLLSLYMVLAFLSDFYKIETFDVKANKFVLYSVLFLVSSISMSSLLVAKNLINKSRIHQLKDAIAK